MQAILSFDKWKGVYSINENIKDAKTFLLKKEKERLRIEAEASGQPLEEFTPEKEREFLLRDTEFQEILQMLSSNQGYVYTFVKFRENSRATIAELRELYQNIRTYASALNTFPMTIDAYSNQETVDGVRSIQAVLDQFDSIKLKKKHGWIIDGVSGHLRSGIKSNLSQSEISRLLRAGEVIDDMDRLIVTTNLRKTERGSTIKDSFLSKSNAFSDAKEYLQRAEEKAASVRQTTVDIVAEKVEDLEPEASVIYRDDLIIVLAIRTEKAQKAICAFGEWCINRNMWNSYGGNSDAVQINVFDYNQSMQDPLFLVGTTIKNGKVTNAHDVYNNGVVGSTNPRAHFESLGYPANVVSNIVSAIEPELTLKQLITGVGFGNSTASELLEKLIKMGDNFISGVHDNYASIIKNTINRRIIGEISEEEIFSTFKKNGILSPYIANLFNTLLPNISEEKRNQLINDSEVKYNALEKIIKQVGLEYSKSATAALKNRSQTEEILRSRRSN